MGETDADRRDEITQNNRPVERSDPPESELMGIHVPMKVVIDLDSTASEWPIVHKVISGSPYEGKLIPGDVLLEIDGVDLRGMTAERVRELMTKKVGRNLRMRRLRRPNAGEGRDRRHARKKWWTNAETLCRIVFPILVGVVMGFWKYHDLSKTRQYNLQFRGSAFTFDEGDIFSDSFFEARRKFLEAAQALNHQATPYVVREHFADKTMDVVVRRGELPGIVIHLSGVGGVDGYAGSAVQTAVLRAIAGSIGDEKGASRELPTVVLVHAVNPMGMHLYKTTNERNVELNRACRTKEEWREFTESRPVRERYDKLDGLLRLRSAPQWWTEQWFQVLLSWFIVRHGTDAINDVFATGQSHDSSGLFFAGFNEFEETSIVNLKKVLLDLRESGAKGAVTLVNMQTGPAKLGESTVRANDRSTVWPMDGKKELERWFAASEIDVSLQRRGRVIDYFEQAFEMIQQPLLIEHEIGTVSAEWALRMRVLERAAEQHMEDKMEAWRFAYRTTKEAYYPSSSKFRAEVLKKGVEVMKRAMDRSVTLSPLKMSVTI